MDNTKLLYEIGGGTCTDIHRVQITLMFLQKLNDSWLYGAVLYTVTGFSDDVF